MSFFEIFMIGVGLSMDAFAVAICKGLNMRKLDKGQTLVIALFFGGFQALMPFVGWLLGKQFEAYITSFDHWIAFVLLAFIGGKKDKRTHYVKTLFIVYAHLEAHFIIRYFQISKKSCAHRDVY